MKQAGTRNMWFFLLGLKGKEAGLSLGCFVNVTRCQTASLARRWYSGHISRCLHFFMIHSNRAAAFSPPKSNTQWMRLTSIKQLSDEVFLIFKIIKVKVVVISRSRRLISEKANLEVMFLLLHWRKEMQSSRPWHDYPRKSCTTVIVYMGFFFH